MKFLLTRLYQFFRSFFGFGTSFICPLLLSSLICCCEADSAASMLCTLRSCASRFSKVNFSSTTGRIVSAPKPKSFNFSSKIGKSFYKMIQLRIIFDQKIDLNTSLLYLIFLKIFAKAVSANSGKVNAS